tara:strand:- start:782 stop:1444 length:663 start_codon:yes stop_codon:yes gene_type:complete
VSDLVRTLITGLVTSVIFLILVWIFWKIYDRPSKRQLEVEQERQEKSKEIRMWRAVEAQMAQEEAEAEALALIERKKAEQRARAIPPPSGVVSNAFAKLDAPTSGEQFNEQFKPKQGMEEIQVEELVEEIQQDDSDVLLAPELVEVRQDSGEDAEHLLELLEQEEESEEEEIEPEIAESEPVVQEAQDTEDQDEKAIADEKVDWDSKSEKDQDDPWSVGW